VEPLSPARDLRMASATRGAAACVDPKTRRGATEAETRLWVYVSACVAGAALRPSSLHGRS
jgi:hypothetical protein